MGAKGKKSFYRINQASANWFDLLKTGLERGGYHPSQVGPCVIYRKDSVMLNYVRDFVIFSHRQDTIISLKESLKNGPGKYTLTD